MSKEHKLLFKETNQKPQRLTAPHKHECREKMPDLTHDKYRFNHDCST